MKFSEKQLLGLLLLLATAIYVGSAGIPALLDDADSFYAEVARTMKLRGDWITPYINGVRYMEKPPLFYWLVILSYKLFGDANTFTARLPTALTVVALVFVTTRLGKLLFGARAGWLAGLALATSFGTFLFTRIILPDALFTLLLSLTLYAFLRWERETEEPQRWVLAIYAFGALAVMARGLIGVLFPGGIIIGTLVLTGRWREIFKLISLKCMLLFFVIALPWHLAIGTRNPGFYWFYFINEHVLRFLGKRLPKDYGTVPLLPFWLLHMVWLFPWSFYLVTLLKPANFKAAWQEQRRELMLPVVWVLLILLFFSFSSRLEYYTLPAFPALALLAGRQCEKYWEAQRNWPGLVLASLGGLLGIALIVVAVTLAGQASGDMFAQLKDNPELYVYYLGHLFDLTPESLLALRVPLVLAGVAFGVFLPLHYFRPSKAALLALGMAFFFVAANLAFLVFAPRMTSKPLAGEITRRAQGDDVIVIDGHMEEGSSVAFYTRHPLLLRNGRISNLQYGSHYPDVPPVFPDDARLKQMWEENRQRIFLVTFQAKQAQLEALLPANRHLLARYGDKLLLSNRLD